MINYELINYELIVKLFNIGKLGIESAEWLLKQGLCLIIKDGVVMGITDNVL